MCLFPGNVVDILWTNKAAYQICFGANFRGPAISFGAEVRYFSTPQNDKARVHQMLDKFLSGIPIGYKQQAGGGWSGNLRVLGWDELNEATHVSRVYERDLPADQARPQKVNHKFQSPLINRDLNQPGLKATEMSRRMIERQRMQKQKEDEEREWVEKQEKEKELQRQEDEETDIQMESVFAQLALPS